MSPEKLDHRVKISWIQIKYLSVIWVSAQRPFKESQAKRIADDFDPDCFTPLQVSAADENGMHHICDGQHRHAAMQMLWGADEKVPCQISNIRDPARAAQMFLKINSQRRAPTSLDKFMVSVVAHSENHVAIARIVNKAGYRITRSKEDKCICAVDALMVVYRRFGDHTLESILKIIQATWGTDGNAVIAPIILGYGEFVHEFGSKVNWQRLTEVVAKKFTPGNLMGMAKSVKEINGGSLGNAVATILLTHY